VTLSPHLVDARHLLLFVVTAATAIDDGLLEQDEIRLDPWFVMAGLVPAIHVFALTRV
jgi:hypothetical protein